MKGLVLVIMVICVRSGYSETWHVFGKYEYHISTSIRSFDGAQSACNALNANLAKVNTNEIQQFLTDTINSLSGSVNTLFIGLKWNAAQKEYQWEDGTILDVAQWGANQPSGTSHKCVVMNNNLDYFWDNVPCGNWNHYICSKKLGTTTTTATKATLPSTLSTTTTTPSKLTGAVTATTGMLPKPTISSTTSRNSSDEAVGINPTNDSDDLAIIIPAVICGVVFLCIVVALVTYKVKYHKPQNTLTPTANNRAEQHVYADIDDARHAPESPSHAYSSIENASLPADSAQISNDDYSRLNRTGLPQSGPSHTNLVYNMDVKMQQLSVVEYSSIDNDVPGAPGSVQRRRANDGNLYSVVRKDKPGRVNTIQVPQGSSHDVAADSSQPFEDHQEA